RRHGPGHRMGRGSHRRAVRGDGHMSGWTEDELREVTPVDELEVTSRRTDDTLRPFVTIWFTVSGDDLYIRSAHGPRNGWFRRAKESGTGRVRIGAVEQG